MKILLCGDFHLDRYTAGYDRYEDVCRGIDATIEDAVAMRADLYVFLGDLTNPSNVRSHRATAKTVEVERRLGEEEIASLWLTGNHDVIEDGSGGHTLLALEAAGGVVLDEPCIYSMKGLDVVALPFTPGCKAYDPVEYIESVSLVGKNPVLIPGHLGLDGAKLGSETTDMPRGRSVEWPIDAINKHLPGAIMVGGHYHRRHEHRGVRFAGSLERLAFGEEGNSPGYIVVEV